MFVAQSVTKTEDPWPTYCAISP